ncbi:ATP-binding protein [Caballeronia sp. S22]|uniref:ATP-binding protein n=1 Tax=Caballeronia sp. S22 TaxID=3137182 RepID=UPI003530620B
MLDNAIKYPADGGDIRVGIQLVQHAAMLLVEDIEIGVPARDLPHIFDPFVQAGFVGQEHPAWSDSFCPGLLDADPAKRDRSPIYILVQPWYESVLVVRVAADNYPVMQSIRHDIFLPETMICRGTPNWIPGFRPAVGASGGLSSLAEIAANGVPRRCSLPRVAIGNLGSSASPSGSATRRCPDQAIG